MQRSNTYNLTYDAENRLASVSGAASATLVYDGDGNRVKATLGGVTTAYVGNHFEWTGSTTTMKKYYYAGGARVAVREGNGSGTTGLSWLLSDHLGSTAITVNSAGTAEVGELRYYAYGGTRYTSGTTPTSRRFTGQIEDATIGLYFYNARYYDAALGRFVQADTIIPSPGNPQSLNRYSYCLGNPLRYTDPSGRFSLEEIEQYLRNEYGDKWEHYWTWWQFDEPFWNMLLEADYGDRLSAYSTHLPTEKHLLTGMFVHGENSTFSFQGYDELEEYQGYGPYHLVDAEGYVKIDAEQIFTTGWAQGTLCLGNTYFASNLGYVWDQPLYNYTEEYGPVFSGVHRRVWYAPNGNRRIDPWAGDSVAYVFSIAEMVLAKAAASAHPYVAVGLAVLSSATSVNNMVQVDFAFQVAYYEPYKNLEWVAR